MVETSVTQSPAKPFFGLGQISKPSDALSIFVGTVRGTVVEAAEARSPDRFAAPEEWPSLYVLGVPLRPLILRGPLFVPPLPAALQRRFLFLLGGRGLH